MNDFIHGKKVGMPDTKAMDSISKVHLTDTLKHLYMDAGIVYGKRVRGILKRQKFMADNSFITKGGGLIGFNEFITQMMEDYFEYKLLNTVEDITQTTKELIQEILSDAYPQGLSFDEIVPKLQALDFTYNRSRLIARTETNCASNMAAMASAKSTGIKYNKVWIAAQDQRTRRIPRDMFDHLAMDNVTIPFEEAFVVPGEVGNETLQQPGDKEHNATAGNLCNCRCTVGFEPVRDANDRLVMADYNVL